MIGKAEQCQCGYEFRYSLVLSPIRPEPVGWMPTIQHHATVCTQKTLYWWRQSAVPWMQRTGTYIREHVIPGIVAVSISAWNWLADSFGSFFTVPPQNESQLHDERGDTTGTDTSHLSDSGEIRQQNLPRYSQLDSYAPTPRRSLPREDATVRCPHCGSPQVHAGKRGWSIWTGLIGSGKIVLTCLKCSHRFSPGSH